MLLVGAAASIAAAAPPERLTLDDAVRIALANQPSLGAARAGRDAAAARTREAWAAFFPSVLGSFAYNPQTANFAATPAFARIFAANAAPGSVAVGITPDHSAACVLNDASRASGSCVPTPPTSLPNTSQMFNFFSAQVGLFGTLFDFGKSYYGVRSAKEGEASSREGIEALALQVRLDARSAFYGGLAADELVAVAEESVRTQRRHRDEMQGFFEVGTRTKVDVAQAQADLAAAELSLARARGQRDGARAALHAALGLEEWREMELVPPPPVSEEPLPADADALDEAVRDRPEPRQLLAQARAAYEQARSLRGSRFPALTLSLGPSFAGISLDNLTPNFQAALTLGYPLLGMNPVLLEGQIREQRANEAAAREQARVARNGIRLETAQALAALRSAREAVVAARSFETAATERRGLANGRFESGLGTVLELSDAELAYVNARAQRIQAEFDLGIAHARLDKALGK
jgi:outer membrane protein